VVLEGLRSQKAAVLRFRGVVGPAPCSVRGPEVSEGCGPEGLSVQFNERRLPLHNIEIRILRLRADCGECI
jgi:hypothetical protein